MAVTNALANVELHQLGDQRFGKAMALCHQSRGPARIYLSLPLLHLLDDQQLQAVFAHELVHAQAHDSRRIAGLHLLAVVAAGVLAVAAAGQQDGANPLLAGPLMLLLGFRTAYLAAMVPVAWRFRQMELAAHERSLDMTHRPKALASAMQVMAAHNRTQGKLGWARLWSVSPSLADVLKVIARWSREHPDAQPVALAGPPPLPQAGPPAPPQAGPRC
jgi:Zn-dependent protease with chaperone function